nr:hypothetical protein CFP56_01098 [Quercus suber]
MSSAMPSIKYPPESTLYHTGRKQFATLSDRCPYCHPAGSQFCDVSRTLTPRMSSVLWRMVAVIAVPPEELSRCCRLCISRLAWPLVIRHVPRLGFRSCCTVLSLEMRHVAWGRDRVASPRLDPSSYVITPTTLHPFPVPARVPELACLPPLHCC